MNKANHKLACYMVYSAIQNECRKSKTISSSIQDVKFFGINIPMKGPVMVIDLLKCV